MGSAGSNGCLGAAVPVTWLLDGCAAGRAITQQPSRLTGRGADDEGQMRRSEVLQVGQGKSSRKVELDQNFSSLPYIFDDKPTLHLLPSLARLPSTFVNYFRKYFSVILLFILGCLGVPPSTSPRPPVSSRALAAHDGGALDGSLRVILEASLGRGVSFGGESSSSFGGDSSLKSAAGSKPLISAAPEGDSDRVDSP